MGWFAELPPRPQRDEGACMAIRQRYKITYACNRRVAKRSPGGARKSTVGRRSSLWLTRSAEGSCERWPQPCSHSAFKDRKIHPKVKALTLQLIGAPCWNSFWYLRKIPTQEHVCKLSIGCFFWFFFKASPDGTRWALKFKLVWIETV